MPTIKLSEAPASELRVVAMHLGLDVSPSHKGAHILALINAAFEGDEYIVPEGEGPSVQTTAPGVAPLSKAPRVLPGFTDITLQQRDGALPYCMVYVNGTSFQIAREVPVIVPNSVVEALDNAIQARGRRDENQRLVGMQSIRRESFTVNERG
ncbi:MAG: hypothetical protein ACJA1L_001543 [Paracoccaceae bacterium]|jgi:hypothetical protein